VEVRKNINIPQRGLSQRTAGRLEEGAGLFFQANAGKSLSSNLNTTMKTSMKYTNVLAAIAFAIVTPLVSGATPEQEKAFTDGYRKALEAGDTKTLNSYLLTKGAAPEAVEMYKMMQGIEPGSKVVTVELAKFDAEEEARNSQPMPGPGGQSFKMPLKLYKKLVIKTETKDANGSSTSSSSVPVAEKDGKLVIPVPVLAK